MTRRELLIDKVRRGEPLNSLERATFKAFVEGGLISPKDMDPATRLQQEQAADQRTLADILQREGGGLRETFPPTAPAESFMGDVAGEVVQKIADRRPEAPSGTQALAQGAGGMVGGLAGQALGGRFGSVAGSAGGVFLGGILTGRSPVDALYDAALQLGADAPLAAAGAGATKAAKGHFAPKISPTSKAALERSGMVDLIAEGSTTGTPYSRGRATQDALRARYGEAYARADQMYDDVRAAAGEIDVRALKKLAKTEKIDIGGDLGKRSAIPFSEAQELKSRLNERASTLRAEGNALEAADYERLAGSLSSQLNAAADQAGVGNLYRQADQFYATEIAGKFHKDATQRVIRFSGSKVVEDLTPSGERAHQRILGGTVEEARTIVTALRGMQDQPDALPLFRQGIVSTMLEKATDARGVLRPDLLLNMVKSPNVPPERLDTYLGKELADGLRDFATNYAKGRVRIQTGPQAAGMAATAVGAGAVGGLGAAVGAGVEVANEMGMLGGLIARSPRVMNTLKLAVLGQDEKALIGLLPSACLVTGQLAGASLRQLFAQPPEGEHVSY